MKEKIVLYLRKKCWLFQCSVFSVQCSVFVAVRGACVYVMFMLRLDYEMTQLHRCFISMDGEDETSGSRVALVDCGSFLFGGLLAPRVKVVA